MPFELARCFELELELGFEFDPELEERDRDLAVDPELRLDALAPRLDLLPLLLRAVAGLDRDDALVERLEPLFEAADPFDDPLLDRLRGLLWAGLPFAMLNPLLGRGNRLPGAMYPLARVLTQA